MVVSEAKVCVRGKNRIERMLREKEEDEEIFSPLASPWWINRRREGEDFFFCLSFSNVYEKRLYIRPHGMKRWREEDASQFSHYSSICLLRVT